MHRRNDNWEPSKASGSIETAIDRFEQALNMDFASLKSTRSSNPTMAQKSILNFIINQKNLMSLSLDKNLGIMIVNRDDYVKDIMDQHLSNRGTYGIITKEEATECLLEARNAFIKHISKSGNNTDSDGVKHVTRCVEQDTRIPVMCG